MPYLIILWKLLLYLNSDHAYCTVVLFIVTYCVRDTLWKSSASIIQVILITENLIIFCLHSIIDDYILLFVPSDWWILDVRLSWFQFCFSGLVSCLLLIFYIKRIHTLDRTWSVHRLNQLVSDGSNSIGWTFPSFTPDDENAVSNMLSLKKAKQWSMSKIIFLFVVTSHCCCMIIIVQICLLSGKCVNELKEWNIVTWLLLLFGRIISILLGVNK
jgi:hypothetical protein